MILFINASTSVSTNWKLFFLALIVFVFFSSSFDLNFTYESLKCFNKIWTRGCGCWNQIYLPANGQILLLLLSDKFFSSWDMMRFECRIGIGWHRCDWCFCECMFFHLFHCYHSQPLISSSISDIRIYSMCCAVVLYTWVFKRVPSFRFHDYSFHW